jgi:tetratricopeptide (TPR) repeat protein
MTEKQIERVKLKIDKWKKALSLDKKKWGGYYHDGGGIRYIIPELYIQIQDYKGALKYFNWFKKNFPDDACYPIFLFEWTFVLFKSKKLPEAEKKLNLTFFSNTYLLDKFLGKAFLNFDKNESSNWEFQSLVEHFNYSKDSEQFVEFAIWTTEKLQSRDFLDKANRFIELEQLIKKEANSEKRSALVKELFQMITTDRT